VRGDFVADVANVLAGAVGARVGVVGGVAAYASRFVDAGHGAKGEMEFPVV
jgi:hypothetical protein